MATVERERESEREREREREKEREHDKRAKPPMNVPPVHSVTLSPVSSKWQPPSLEPRAV